MSMRDTISGASINAASQHDRISRSRLRTGCWRELSKSCTHVVMLMIGGWRCRLGEKRSSGVCPAPVSSRFDMQLSWTCRHLDLVMRRSARYRGKLTRRAGCRSKPPSVLTDSRSRTCRRTPHVCWRHGTETRRHYPCSSIRSEVYVDCTWDVLECCQCISRAPCYNSMAGPTGHPRMAILNLTSPHEYVLPIQRIFSPMGISTQHNSSPRPVAMGTSLLAWMETYY